MLQDNDMVVLGVELCSQEMENTRYSMKKGEKTVTFSYIGIVTVNLSLYYTVELFPFREFPVYALSP